METQTAIAETIRKRRADYVLAVKGNQGILEQDICLYFKDEQVLEGIKKNGGYKKTSEKAHGQIGKREHYQTEDIGWLRQRKQWKSLKSIEREEWRGKPFKRERQKRGIPVLYKQSGRKY